MSRPLRRGDCYARTLVRVEEMRQSLRIIEQCLKNMPAGPYKADHHLATPPRKERTMHDIETLITHFLGVSWGPVIPPGEAFVAIEATKGNNGYYLISDGGIHPYRARIRTPSFAHVQMIPLISSRVHGCRYARRFWAVSITSWRMWTAEFYFTQQDEKCLPRKNWPRSKRNLRITRKNGQPASEALKAVQRRRGWVSDESSRDLADFMEMTDRRTG